MYTLSHSSTLEIGDHDSVSGRKEATEVAFSIPVQTLSHSPSPEKEENEGHQYEMQLFIEGSFSFSCTHSFTLLYRCRGKERERNHFQKWKRHFRSGYSLTHILFLLLLKTGERRQKISTRRGGSKSSKKEREPWLGAATTRCTSPRRREEDSGGMLHLRESCFFSHDQAAKRLFEHEECRGIGLGYVTSILHLKGGHFSGLDLVDQKFRRR